jgi:hypothetical protein
MACSVMVTVDEAGTNACTRGDTLDALTPLPMTRVLPAARLMRPGANEDVSHISVRAAPLSMLMEPPNALFRVL